MDVYCLCDADLPSRILSTICIPGGTLRHGTTELAGTKALRTVSEVVLALGLNNVLNRNLVCDASELS